MKLDSWEFYVLPTKELDKHCGVQRTISLNALLRLSPQKVDFCRFKICPSCKVCDRNSLSLFGSFSFYPFTTGSL